MLRSIIRLLRNIELRDILLAALTGILLLLSFPKWDLEGLAWFAFIPLFVAIENKNPHTAFILGWISGFVFFFGTLSWITTTIVTYGHIAWLTGFLAFLLMTFILSCYCGAFCMCLQFCGAWPILPKSLLAPFLWTGLEFLRGHFFIPFPWDSLGYSQYRMTWLIQIADITSVYGVSFLIVLVNRVLFEFAYIFSTHGKSEKPPLRFSWIPGITAFLLLLSVLAYGRIKMILPEGGKSMKVSVIQGNIDQDKKWDEQYRDETLSLYEKLTRKASESRPDLIVWPETAVPFLFEREIRYQERLKEFVSAIHIPLLFGSPALDRAAGENEWYNSAYLLDSDGRLVNRYDKINLVPFGEYIPFHSLLFFVNKITEGIGDFKPGKRTTVFEIPGHPVGTLICFEVIFPELFRKFVDRGAVLMTTMTNDAWFGATSAPYQHFSMVVFRAVENRTPVARAANTGISGFIDSRGHILATSPLFVSAEMTQDLPFFEERSFYTRYGDLFGWCTLLIGSILIGITIIRRKRHAG